MTKEEQRIAIAEFEGWVRNRDSQGFTQNMTHATRGIIKHFDELPDYLNSLDAMHEVEEKLDNNERNLFGGFLYAGKVCSFQDFCTGIIVFNMSHLTATQRAEALLRTIGKWKD